MYPTTFYSMLSPNVSLEVFPSFGSILIRNDILREKVNVLNVLKTGPDRPVEPSTGLKTGPVQSKNRFCIEPAVNRPNRRSDR